MYNFDKVVERRGTGSKKWDLIEKNHYPADILPMWIADMDFEVLPEITEALTKRISEHHIYGYGTTLPGQNEAASSWFSRRYGWDFKPAWIVNTPGIVNAVKMAILAFTQPGESILIQSPLYYPFPNGIRSNGRKLVESPFKRVDTHFEIDFEDFERKIIDNDVKMFILCNPHNPVGKVFTREELKRMGDICMKHNVLIVDDEIHCEFVYGGRKYVPFLTVDPAFASRTIVCTAASKTFNIAGFKFSNIVIPDDELRKAYSKQLDACGTASTNFLGGLATMTAYNHGDAWVDEMIAYMEGNVRFFKEYLGQKLPELTVMDPEGLYLIWVDCSAWGLTDEELGKFIIHEAHVWLEEGSIFGDVGAGYERFNLACPRSVVKECVDRIAEAAIRCHVYC